MEMLPAVENAGSAPTVDINLNLIGRYCLRQGACDRARELRELAASSVADLGELGVTTDMDGEISVQCDGLTGGLFYEGICGAAGAGRFENTTTLVRVTLGISKIRGVPYTRAMISRKK